MCCIVKCCNCHFISAGDMAGVACQGLVCVCVLEKWQKICHFFAFESLQSLQSLLW